MPLALGGNLDRDRCGEIELGDLRERRFAEVRVPLEGLEEFAEDRGSAAAAAEDQDVRITRAGGGGTVRRRLWAREPLGEE